MKMILPKSRRITKDAESERVLRVLHDYLESNFEEPMRWLVHMWEDQATAITYKELLSIVTGEDNPEQIFNTWYGDYSRLIEQQMTPAWKDAMYAAWKNNPRFAGMDISQLVGAEENVVNWLTEHSTRLITNCMDEQRNAIRYIISESHSKMMSSAETARYIRPCIGLTERQAEANLKHYTSVKETLRADHPRISEEEIERRARVSAGKYAAKQQRYRAETIARTEIAYAYNNANDDWIRMGMEQGLLPHMVKEISCSHSGKVCETCLDLDGERYEMDELVNYKMGRKLKTVDLPPFHPRCACAVKYIEV